jgi:hypothetical protein
MCGLGIRLGVNLQWASALIGPTLLCQIEPKDQYVILFCLLSMKQQSKYCTMKPRHRIIAVQFLVMKNEPPTAAERRVTKSTAWLVPRRNRQSKRDFSTSIYGLGASSCAWGGVDGRPPLMAFTCDVGRVRKLSQDLFFQGAASQFI